MQTGDMIKRVGRLIGRTLPGADILVYINSARDMISRLSPQWEFLYQTDPLILVVDQMTYDLPDNYEYMFGIHVNGIKLIRAPEYYVDLIENEGNGKIGQGTPVYYLKRGLQVALLPIPDTSAIGFSAEFRYFGYPVPLVNLTDEDFMAKRYYKAIIYGAAYLGNDDYEQDDRADKCKARYDEEVAIMWLENKRKKWKDSIPRIRTWRDFTTETFNNMTSQYIFTKDPDTGSPITGGL